MTAICKIICLEMRRDHIEIQAPIFMKVTYEKNIKLCNIVSLYNSQTADHVK